MVFVDRLRFFRTKDSYYYRTKDQVQRRLDACAARQFDAQPAKRDTWGRRLLSLGSVTIEKSQSDLALSGGPGFVLRHRTAASIRARPSWTGACRGRTRASRRATRAHRGLRGVLPGGSGEARGRFSKCARSTSARVGGGGGSPSLGFRDARSRTASARRAGASSAPSLAPSHVGGVDATSGKC